MGDRMQQRVKFIIAALIFVAEAVSAQWTHQ